MLTTWPVPGCIQAADFQCRFAWHVQNQFSRDRVWQTWL